MVKHFPTLLLLLLSSYFATAQPTAPTNLGASNTIICPGSSTNLSATVPSGYQVKWYTQASGGTAIGTTASNATLSVAPSATTTYYAETAPISTYLTYNYSGVPVSWTVPAGVSSIQIDARGASGSAYSASGQTSRSGGKGGRLEASIPVTSGEVLVIKVGGQGGNSSSYNGGGIGRYSGGGATEIRRTDNTLLAIVGGGGGAGTGADGGNGGDVVAANGTNGVSCFGGAGGTGSAGGTKGNGSISGSTSDDGTNGTLGQGGLGGTNTNNTNAGGCGGGGYYGGGGGGSNAMTAFKSAGGGGGSSYTIGTATNVTHTQGENTGNGTITITPIGLPSATREMIEIIVVTTPTNIQSANLTPTGIDLSWTAPLGALEYEWKVVASGAGVNGAAVASATNTQNAYISISTLTQGTNYDFYIRSKCAAGGTSEWSPAFAFATPVPPPIPEITLVKVRNMCSDRNSIRVTFTNRINTPITYSVTSDIVDFTPIVDATIPAAGASGITVLNISTAGSTIATATPYTLTLTVKNALGGISQDYFVPMTFYDIPTDIPAYTTSALHVANESCLDANAWTHYINTNTGTLLLSINEGEWNPGTLVTNTNPDAAEYAVTVGMSGTTGYKYVPTGGYVTLPSGWYVMSGTYDVLLNDVNTQEPTSEVTVRSYFHEAQFNAINAILGAAGANYEIPSYNDLTVYKLLNHANSFSALSGATPHSGIGETGIKLYNNTSNDHPDFSCSPLAGATGVRYFQYSVDAFSGGGGGGGIGGAMPGAAVLPVELSSFTATDWNNQIKLDWTTASEINNKSFTVEKSIDGQIFTPIEEVSSLAINGMSNIPLNYEYTDIYPQSFQYYRLKQTDIDGAMRVCSQTIQIPANVDFAVFPNPASDEVSLLFKDGGRTQKYQVEIFNSLGVKVLTERYTEKDISRKLSLKTLPAGIYNLRISEEKGRILNQTTLVKK